MSTVYETLITQITTATKAVNSITTHKQLVPLLLQLRNLRDDLKKLHTEVDRLFYKGSVKAAALINAERELAMVNGKPIPSSYSTDNCSYSLKEDVAYKVTDTEAFANSLGIHPRLMQKVREESENQSAIGCLFSPHYVNIVKFMEAYPEVSIDGIEVTKTDTITIRRK